MIIGRFPGLRCPDGADDSGPTQVGGVRRGIGRLLRWGHAEDVVKKACVRNQQSHDVALPVLPPPSPRAAELLRVEEDFTTSAVGVAHVVCGSVAAVVGVGGSRVDSDVLTPVHLTQGETSSSSSLSPHHPHQSDSLHLLTFSLVSRLRGSTRLMKLVSVLT